MAARHRAISKHPSALCCTSRISPRWHSPALVPCFAILPRRVGIPAPLQTALLEPAKILPCKAVVLAEPGEVHEPRCRPGRVPGPARAEVAPSRGNERIVGGPLPLQSRLSL